MQKLHEGWYARAGFKAHYFRHNYKYGAMLSMCGYSLTREHRETKPTKKQQCKRCAKFK